MIAYALTLLFIAWNALEAAMQLEAVLAPKFRVLAKGGRVCPFSVFQILFPVNWLLDAWGYPGCQALNMRGFRVSVLPDTEASSRTREKKSPIPRVGVRFQLAWIDCVSFEIEAWMNSFQSPKDTEQHAK